MDTLFIEVYTIVPQSTRIFAEYQRKKILRTPLKSRNGKAHWFLGEKRNMLLSLFLKTKEGALFL